jgi:hypothetical protein
MGVRGVKVEGGIKRMQIEVARMTYAHAEGCILHEAFFGGQSD